MDGGESDSAADAPGTGVEYSRVINATLRGVIGAETVREVGEAVEDAFADGDRYRTAWLGSVHPSTGEVTGHGESEQPAGSVADDRFRPEREAVAEVVRTGDRRVVPGRSDQSVVGLFPVRDGDAFQGVLAVHTDSSDGFAPREGDALAALASSIADRIDDIAERDRLTQKTERLEAFTKTVSHDLRNPIEVLEHSIELVAETENIEHLDRCRDAADRMETLVEDLRVLAQQGDIVDERREVGVQSLVTDCWRTVETAEASLSVETDARVCADRERLQQLFENLFRNAVEHGATGSDRSVEEAAEIGSASAHSPARGDAADTANCDGPLTITVGATGDSLYVADDGCGIPAGEREAVFEQGFSTAVNGSGFGLAIVEEIANAHGWTVQIDDSEAGGARFDIRGVEFA